MNTLTLARGIVTWGYHPTTGNLQTITAPGGSTLTYSYNGSLLTGTTWAGTMAGTVSRTYDTDFRLATESINGGQTVSFGYDADSLLTQAGALSISRNAQNGLITGTALGATTTTQSHTTFGENEQVTASHNGTTLSTAHYTRDKLGRITEKIETIDGLTSTYGYGYDLAGRLTDVTLNGTNVSHYTYDANGNRLSDVEPSETLTGTYDTQDRLLTYGPYTYTYNANGDLASKTDSTTSSTMTYQYDELGNLLGVTLSNGTQIEYVIDGQNRRIGKKVNGTLVRGWLYANQLNPVAELDGTGAVVARFVYGTKANVPDYIVTGGVTYRILSDHLGSPRMVINTTTGTIAQQLDYDEFGIVITDTNIGFQPFGFAGGLYDPDTGLVRFGARDYDAATGRWTAKDPIKFFGAGANLYLYTLANPLNLIDPYGLWQLEYNAGFHIPLVPPVVSVGTNIGSKLVDPLSPSGHLEAKDPVSEIVWGSWLDAGVSAGVGDLSGTGGKCAGATIGLNVLGGKYGGFSVTLRKDAQVLMPSTWFDGFSFGLGVGLSLPVTVTTEF